MDRNLALELVRVTEAAALASARFFGKGDPAGADRAAVDAMHLAVRGVKISGRIVIGEEPGEAGAKLAAGEIVGVTGETALDVAIDPIDCIDSLADGQANSISAIALGDRGAFIELRAPYMRKLVVGPDAADRIDLKLSVFDNLVRIAEAKRVYVEDLTVAILDRDWNRRIVDEVRRAGSRIELLRDGDLAGAISAALPGTGVDVMMGTGLAKQGIIAAAALACLGAGFHAQFLPEPQAEPESLGPEHRPYCTVRDLVGGENVMFAATGVSHSDFLDGVLFRPGGAITNSVVLRSKSGTIRFLKTEHFFEKTPDYT